MVCSTATRTLQAQMQLDTPLSQLAATLAITLKWATHDVALSSEGCPLSHDTTLESLEAPYMIDVHRWTPIMKYRQSRRERRPRVEMDLGKIHKQEAVADSVDMKENEHDKHSNVGGVGTSASSSSSHLEQPGTEKARDRDVDGDDGGDDDDKDTTTQEDRELRAMRLEDHDVRLIHLRRPREQEVHQFRGQFGVRHYISCLAAAKRQRRGGFTLYTRVGEESVIRQDETYMFLTWDRELRGGVQDERCSVLTVTETFVGSEEDSRDSIPDMREARIELDCLHDLINRINMANSYLASFKRKAREMQVLTLQAWKLRRERQELRGGMHNAGSQPRKEGPSRWESSENAPGLILKTAVTVTLKGKDEGTLPMIMASDVVDGAHGVALITWDSWLKMESTRSEKPLLVILPGHKVDVIPTVSAIEKNRLKLAEVILEPAKESGTPVKPFSKRVTIVNHTRCPDYVFDLQHGGQPIQITPALECQVFADLYEDTASPAQDWTPGGLRRTYQNTLQSWEIKGEYACQWPTIRYVKEASRSTVIIRADKQARHCLLVLSGKGLIFTRERQAKEEVLGYAAIWLQTASHQGTPSGVINALAKKIEGHYGICRNARGYGLRAPNDKIAQARTILRPQDGALNDQNRQIVPTDSWILRGVLAQATGPELATAISKFWPILPLRQMSVKRSRATWLVQASQEPPKNVLHTEEMIIFVEKHEQGRARPKTRSAGMGGSKGGSSTARGQGGVMDRDRDRGSSSRVTPNQREERRGVRAESKKSGSAALRPGDPWGAYAPGTGSGGSASTEGAVMNRLRKAEEAIVRIEHKQQHTDQAIAGMQSLMDQRFQEVLNGLASLQGEPRRKARPDQDEHRGGELISRWVAANITSLPKRWEEVASLEADVVCLTETLAIGRDHQWLRKAFAGAKKTFVPGSACLQVGALNARKAGVAFALADGYSAMPLGLEGIMMDLYHQARLHAILIGALGTRHRVRAVVYYGVAGQYSQNAREISQVIDMLSAEPDLPTLLGGGLQPPRYT